MYYDLGELLGAAWRSRSESVLIRLRTDAIGARAGTLFRDDGDMPFFPIAGCRTLWFWVACSLSASPHEARHVAIETPGGWL